MSTAVLIACGMIVGYAHPNNSKLVNLQELLHLMNLTILYDVSYQSNEANFTIVTNFVISLAFFQFCTIVFYHFLTYTCHCNVLTTLQTMKAKMIKLCYIKK